MKLFLKMLKNEHGASMIESMIGTTITLAGIMSMLPGISKVQKLMDNNNISDDLVKQQIAIISSMTKKEKFNPDIIYIHTTNINIDNYYPWFNFRVMNFS